MAITKHIKTHPDFFVELLRAYYNREDGLEDEDIKLLSYERRNHLRQTAFDILNDFDAIPCLDKEEDDAPLDLRTWITRALEIAKSVHRKGYAVSKIGDALARAPVNENGPWPRDHICDVMEEFWSDKLACGFTCGCVSKLGVRYVGEGEPDAELAEKYAAWAKNRELTHPRVSCLLRNLAARFDRYSEGHRSDAEYRRQVE